MSAGKKKIANFISKCLSLFYMTNDRSTLRIGRMRLRGGMAECIQDRLMRWYKLISLKARWDILNLDKSRLVANRSAIGALTSYWTFYI